MFKAVRITGLRHLRSLCCQVGKDVELRGKQPVKYVMRYNPSTRKYFVFNRISEKITIVPPTRLGEILKGLRTKKLWTCEGLRFDQILKWPWQVKLAEEKKKIERMMGT